MNLSHLHVRPTCSERQNECSVHCGTKDSTTNICHRNGRQHQLCHLQCRRRPSLRAEQSRKHIALAYGTARIAVSTSKFGHTERYNQSGRLNKTTVVCKTSNINTRKQMGHQESFGMTRSHRDRSIHNALLGPTDLAEKCIKMSPKENKCASVSKISDINYLLIAALVSVSLNLLSDDNFQCRALLIGGTQTAELHERCSQRCGRGLRLETKRSPHQTSCVSLMTAVRFYGNVPTWHAGA